MRERKIPPKAEQTKIFHEVVKEGYYHSFLIVYESIWKNIKNSQYDLDKIMDAKKKNAIRRTIADIDKSCNDTVLNPEKPYVSIQDLIQRVLVTIIFMRKNPKDDN